MSLKAKIEAVIYASDEPVTLAQLLSLLGQEAQAELDREAAAQATLALDDAALTEAAAAPEAAEPATSGEATPEATNTTAQMSDGSPAASDLSPCLPPSSVPSVIVLEDS
ncbi:MAG TPA: SMC-Scp complex subunit ScpB, partial [Acidobacteriaceae bacterium]|nr:SMC-Scp complex subunit ScpB [Acidobacteriaceae bacterium]